MSRGAITRHNDTTALVFVSDWSDLDWGWWCPVCTPDTIRPEIVGEMGYKGRGAATRAAHQHEEHKHATEDPA